MKSISLTLIVMLIAFAGSRPARAGRPLVSRGDHVQVQVADGDTIRTLEGRVIEDRSGVLVVNIDGTEREIPHSRIDWVARRETSGGATVSGGAIGLVIGVLIAVTTTPKVDDGGNGLDRLDRMDESIARGLTITAGCTVIGVVLGHALAGDDWQMVRLAYTPQAGPDSRGGMWRMACRLEF